MQTESTVERKTALAETESGGTVPCRHCGLPSPAPPTADVDTPAFCCAGCRGAYELIHGWGLEDYYALRDRLANTSGEAVVNASRYDELDDPTLLGRSAPQSAGGDLLCCRLAIGGLHCGACAWLIERSARLLPGWESARVRMHDHTIDVVFAPGQTKLSQIASTLDRLGYRVAPLANCERADRAAAENRQLLVQIAIAGFCAANSMWIAVALYAGRFSGIQAEYETVLRWAGVLLGLLAVSIPGRTFFRGAWAALRTWTPHMDLPVALGLGVGAIAGLVGAISGVGEVYFDSIAVLVFFLLVGRWVQFRQQRRAAESVGLLMRLAPPSATRVEADGSLKQMPTDALRAGDLVRVVAGEGVPADGTIEVGYSLLDRSLMTGESQPVEVGPGDSIEAGTANLRSQLDIRVTAVGMESRVGRLMQLVEEAAGKKSPVVQLADAVGGWFVSIVILLALVTLGWWWSSGPAAAAQHAVALLIVACPCALALATPLALAVGLGRSARRKILVRGGDVLERLARPGKVWFDKTGTLTVGRLRITEVLGERDVELESQAELQTAVRLAAAVESQMRHPVAAAIEREANRRDLVIATADEVSQTIGGGVYGVVEGRDVLVGNSQFLREQGVDVEPWAVAHQQRITGDGASSVLIALDGRLTAILRLEDTLRDDAAELVQSLQRLGWEVGILSGDHPRTVAQIAAAAGISAELALGGLTPEAKLAQIEASKQTPGPVLMVGDGVNDAAALAAADVGVAVRGGAEASLEAAPVYLADGRLAGLADLMHASQRTVSVIRRNFAASLSYNVIAVILAMAGQINPLVAAVLMPISSLTVLSMTLASPTFSTAERTS
ncbi:heavy metal translocating P-type ATPase [Planctomycetaceae bacterium SH139]